MSTEAYARAQAREAKMWKPFLYAFPCSDEQTTERTLIFGLYSYSYNNLHGYLIEVEAADLSNIVTDYNTKISGLTNEETITVLAITTKRYLAGIDKIIHDQKMVTEQEKIDSASDLMDAKFSALDADRDALATLALKVEVETNKTEARIAELEALIDLEGANYDLAEIEVTKKNLELAETNLKILKAANEILKLQIMIVEAGIEITEIDLKKARLQLDKANTEQSIAKLDNLDNELAMANAQTELEIAQGALIDANIDSVNNKITNVGTETEFYETLDAAEAAMGTAKTSLINVQTAAKLQGYDNDALRHAISLEYKKLQGDLELVAVNARIAGRAAKSAENDDKNSQQIALAARDMAAEVAAAAEMAMANIASTLTHSIGAA